MLRKICAVTIKISAKQNVSTTQPAIKKMSKILLVNKALNQFDNKDHFQRQFKKLCF